MNNSIYTVSVTDEKLHLWISVIHSLVAGPQLTPTASQIYVIPLLLAFIFWLIDLAERFAKIPVSRQLPVGYKYHEAEQHKLILPR